MKDDVSDYLDAASGAGKHALSRIPIVGEALAGYETYRRSKFDREVRQFLNHLDSKVEDVNALFSGEWLRTKDGEQFAWKVVDAALDAQMEDKQELFVNALINGVKEAQLSQLQKLQFVDILRHLSRASLMVLADMHNMFKDKVRGPGRAPEGNPSYPVVDPVSVATDLSSKTKLT